MAGASFQIQIRHIRVTKKEIADLLVETIGETKAGVPQVQLLMKLAGKYSDCFSKGDGGNLGWVEMGWNPEDPRKPRGGFQKLANEELHDIISQALMKKEITQQSDNFNLTDNSRFTDKSIFLSKIKGTRGVQGARKAVELLCAQMKDEISKKALRVESNATTIDSIPLEHSALFQDRAYLIGLLPNDLNITIDDRINTYIANQKTINKKQIIQDETSAETLNDTGIVKEKEMATAEFTAMEILETKKVITALLKSSSDEDIIKALTMCLRLLEDERSRLWQNRRHKNE